MGANAVATLYLLGKLAAAFALLAVSGLAGILVLPRREGDFAAERLAVGATLGLGLLSQAFLLLGLAGALTAAGVSILLVTVSLAAVLLRRRLLLDDLSELRREIAGAPLLAILAACALGILLAAAAIRVPQVFDETMYHLPYARAFAETGRLPFLEDVRFPIFPQAAEALFAACLLLADDVTAHFVSLVATLLAVALAALWARREAGGRAGLIAAALLLGDPILACYSGLGYVDPLLMLFGTGCLYALSRATGSWEARWTLLSGALAGCAASVKYHGLFFIVAAGAAVLLFGGRRRWRGAALFACAAAVAALPTYGRLIVETGNPVFPFASSVFGPSAWSDWDILLPGGPEEASKSLVPELLSKGQGLFDHLVLGRGVSWGPSMSPLLGLAALCGLLYAFRRRGPAAWFFVMAVVYFGIVLMLPPDPRFLMPFAPGVAALGGAFVATAMGRLRPGLGRMLASLLLLAMLFPGASYLVRVQDDRGPLPLTAEVREQTLERLLPAYRAVRDLNRQYGSDYVVYGFGAENLAYFAKGHLRGDFFGPWAYWRILMRADAPGGVTAALSEMSATHLLIVRGSLHADRVPTSGLFVQYQDESASVYRLSATRAPTPPPRP